MQTFPAVVLAIFFTLIAGVFDAKGFVAMSRVWNDGRFAWRDALQSLLYFQGGIMTFWFAIRYLQQLKVRAAEVQTVFWFGITMIGIAVLSRQFITWPPVDRAVSIAVLLGIAWLVYRTGG